MKSLIVLSVVLAISLAQDYYTTHNDLDIEALVTNPETLQEITHCFIETGPCNERDAPYKKVLPEATQTACAKCSPTQKHMLKRYLQEVRKIPADYEALRQKYDPESKYIEALRAALADA